MHGPGHVRGRCLGHRLQTFERRLNARIERAIAAGAAKSNLLHGARGIDPHIDVHAEAVTPQVAVRAQLLAQVRLQRCGEGQEAVWIAAAASGEQLTAADAAGEPKCITAGAAGFAEPKRTGRA